MVIRFSMCAALAIVASLTACSASRTVVESDLGIKGAPDWVNEGRQAFNDSGKRFFRGTGSAPAMNDDYLQRATADNRARSELAQIFSSYMDALVSDYSAAHSDGSHVVNEQSVSRSIKNSTDINLLGTEIIARWKDPKTGVIYSLAELDMKRFSEVAAAAKEMDAGLQKHVLNEAGNVFDSFSKRANNE